MMFTPSYEKNRLVHAPGLRQHPHRTNAPVVKDVQVLQVSTIPISSTPPRRNSVSKEIRSVSRCAASAEPLVRDASCADIWPS